jgi:hypothetical protein
VGAIAGGVAGGILVIVIAMILIYCLCWKKKTPWDGKPSQPHGGTQILAATKNSFLRWFGPKWYVVVVASIHKLFSALLSYSWTHISTNWWFEWTDEEVASSHPSSSGTKYTLAQVNAATNNNARLLGRGGFGPVYYGKLPGGREVAVKVSAKGSAQGTREFLNEVGLFSWTVNVKGRPFMTVQVTVWFP